MIERKEDEFIFADAYIGCYVSKLMGWQDLVRLANCGDLNAAQSILMEFDYSEPKDQTEFNVESFIRHEQTKLYERVFSNLNGREEMAPFLYPYDYHNIKVCLKSELMGIAPDESIMAPNGNVDWLSVVAMVRDRNYMQMRPVMKDAVQEVLDLYGRSGDPQEIDLVLDRACYKDMALGAAETGSGFITDLVRMKIDTLNLKTFARLKTMGRPWSFFKKAFIPEGVLTEDFFISNYEDSMNQFAEKLIHPGLKAAVSEGGRMIDETGRFTLYEKMLDNAFMEENKKARFFVTGIEPIAGYWFAKDMEIDNVRITLNGLKIHSAPEEILEFLRQPYV